MNTHGFRVCVVGREERDCRAMRAYRVQVGAARDVPSGRRREGPRPQGLADLLRRVSTIASCRDESNHLPLFRCSTGRQREVTTMALATSSTGTEAQYMQSLIQASATELHRIVTSKIQKQQTCPQRTKRRNLARYIDHTCLKPDATPDDILRLINEAKRHKFKAVCINSSYVQFAKEQLCGSDAPVICSVVGFPLGSCMTEVKVEEARRCILAGAREIDMVVHIGNAKAGNWKAVIKDIRAVYSICNRGYSEGGDDPPIPLKVIFETCLLTKEEIRRLCKICVDIGVAFVKTSTGFSCGGATPEDVSLMREVVGDTCGVKASGGVRNRATAFGHRRRAACIG